MGERVIRVKRRLGRRWTLEVPDVYQRWVEWCRLWRVLGVDEEIERIGEA